MDSVAANIVKRREALGLSQAELARVIGVSGATLSRWESGITRPARNNLEQLATALCTTPASLHETSSHGQPIDAATLALALANLETVLGRRFTSLPALQRAKLLAFAYSRPGAIDVTEANALMGLLV